MLHWQDKRVNIQGIYVINWFKMIISGRTILMYFFNTLHLKNDFTTFPPVRSFKHSLSDKNKIFIFSLLGHLSFFLRSSNDGGKMKIKISFLRYEAPIYS